MRDFIITTMFNPAEDHKPWNVVKVYRDGNPIYLDRFKTEDEADDLVADLNVLGKVLRS